MTRAPPPDTIGAMADVDRQALVRAVAQNHRCWFERRAAACGGAVVSGPGGLTWAWLPPSRQVAFMLGPLHAGDLEPALDAVVAFAAERRVHETGAWWPHDSWPERLGDALRDRGFQEGWAPHWMGASVADLAIPDAAPDGVEVRVTGGGAAFGGHEVPYAESAPFVDAVARAHPGRAFQVGAFRAGRPIGRAVVHLTGATAGLFDVGVVPAERRRGVGGALTLAACAAARERGAQSAVLNATGEGEALYRALGFASLGRGMTWWRFGARR